MAYDNRARDAFVVKDRGEVLGMLNSVVPVIRSIGCSVAPTVDRNDTVLLREVRELFREMFRVGTPSMDKDDRLPVGSAGEVMEGRSVFDG